MLMRAVENISDFYLSGYFSRGQSSSVWPRSILALHIYIFLSRQTDGMSLLAVHTAVIIYMDTSSHNLNTQTHTAAFLYPDTLLSPMTGRSQVVFYVNLFMSVALISKTDDIFFKRRTC
jgi:hypothetical protein